MRRFESSRPSKPSKVESSSKGSEVSEQETLVGSRLSPDFIEKSYFTDDSSSSTYVHPSSVVGPHVTLGTNVKIGPFCTILGTTTIGDGTRLSGYVSVGFEAEVRGMAHNHGAIVIGKNTTIREFATIHAPKTAESKTSIGDNSYIMNYVHVSHDATVGNNVVLTNGVSLAGFAVVGDNANLMAHSAMHQFCKIGEYSALTPFSGTRQDLPPFCMFEGKGAFFAGLNRIGLRRAGIPQSTIEELRILTRWFYQEKITLSAIQENITATGLTSPEVHRFISFVETSQRGVSRRSIQDRSENGESL